MCFREKRIKTRMANILNEPIELLGRKNIIVNLNFIGCVKQWLSCHWQKNSEMKDRPDEITQKAAVSQKKQWKI